MSQTYDWLRVLELEPGVSFDEIRRAHRDLAKVWHPDRFPNDHKLRSKAEERQKRINDAFGNLKKWVDDGHPLPRANNQHGHISSARDVRTGTPPVRKRDPHRDTWSVRPPLRVRRRHRVPRRKRILIARWVVAAIVVAGFIVAFMIGRVL